MSYIVITVWELLIRTIYLYQTPAVFLMLITCVHHAITVPCHLDLKRWKRIVKYNLLLDIAHCLVDCKFHLMLLNFQGKVLCTLDSDKCHAYWPRYCEIFYNTLSLRAIIGCIVLRGSQSMNIFIGAPYLDIAIGIHVCTCWEWMWL